MPDGPNALVELNEQDVAPNRLDHELMRTLGKGARALCLLLVGRDSSATPVLEPVVLPTTTPDPSLDALDDLIHSYNTGAAIKDPGQIIKLVSNLGDRAELVSNVMLNHDMTRLVKFAKARQAVEDKLLDIANDPELTVVQAIALHEIVSTTTDSVHAKVRAGGSSAKDLLGMLNKVDFAMQMAEGDLNKKFAATTPQGREIVRRLAHKLRKVANAGSAAVIHDV